MLVLTTIFLAALWHQAPSCPSSFTVLNTTIGAVSDSAQLSLCASKAILVKGSNGSISLAIGADNSSAPKCLVYPNGLNPDLMSSLLQSGHVGCWSLYPPSQPVAIVNIGKPNRLKLANALKSFRPTTPRIYVTPNSGILVGNTVHLTSSAGLQILKTTLLGLPAQVRFKPVRFSWSLLDANNSLTKSALVQPNIVARSSGRMQVNLTVGFSIDYRFVGLTGWNVVQPYIYINAFPVGYLVTEVAPPLPVRQVPRLVAKPCQTAIVAWGC